MINIPNVQLPKRRIVIPKFTPGGSAPKIGNATLSNTQNSDPLFWDNFNKQILARWSEIGQGQDFTLDELNQFVKTNRSLFNSLSYVEGGDAIHGGQAVNQYQRNFHNKYGFGNGDGNGNGGLHTGFTSTNSKYGSLRTGDVAAPAGQFVGDEYFGEQTNRRRATFFNDEELAQANNAVKARGWEFVLDPEQMNGYTVKDDNRKFYMLREIPKEVPSKKTIIPSPDKEIPPLQFNPVEKTKKEPFTDWIPHVLTGLADVIKASKVGQIARRLNPPLEQAPYQHYEKTDNYALDQAYKQQAADTLAQGSRNQTSNSDQNLATQMSYQDKASQLLQKGELAKAQQYSDSTEKANEVGWGNTQRATSVANRNRKVIGATEQYLNESRAKEIVQKTDAIKNTISGIWQDAKGYVHTNQLNQAHANNRAFQQKISDQKNALMAKFNQQWGDFTTSDDYKQWYDYVNSDENRNKFNISEHDGEGWLRTNWSTHAEAKRFRDNYDKNKSAAWYQMQQQLASLDAQSKAGPNQPAYFMGQLTWDAFGPQSQSYRSPAFSSYYKKGGKVDKMADYIKTIQREHENVRNNRVKSRTSELQRLEKELDRINQKQILLLKEIFG